MYKSKLQELCQQRAWELPKYEATKQGVDHNPHFYATVTVNGVSFQSQSPSNTSKKAQNDAAKLAFDHFSLLRPSSSSSSHMQYLFKNQLQTYAQKRNLALPVYSSERVGPPHASRFKGKVTVNGQIYESEEYFPTLKKAEHAAAKAASMTLLPDGVEQDESGFKNLLQDLAQKEGPTLPAYCTNRYGEAHMPTFILTVVIEGESFTGLAAKTKKQAEMSAAKVAYILLEVRLDSGSTVESVPSSSGAAISCSPEHKLSSSSSPSGSSATLATSSSIENLVGKSTSG